MTYLLFQHCSLCLWSVFYVTFSTHFARLPDIRRLTKDIGYIYFWIYCVCNMTIFQFVFNSRDYHFVDSVSCVILFSTSSWQIPFDFTQCLRLTSHTIDHGRTRHFMSLPVAAVLGFHIIHEELKFSSSNLEIPHTTSSFSFISSAWMGWREACWRSLKEHKFTAGHGL